MVSRGGGERWVNFTYIHVPFVTVLANSVKADPKSERASGMGCILLYEFYYVLVCLIASVLSVTPLPDLRQWWFLWHYWRDGKLWRACSHLWHTQSRYYQGNTYTSNSALIMSSKQWYVCYHCLSDVLVIIMTVNLFGWCNLVHFCVTFFAAEI